MYTWVRSLEQEPSSEGSEPQTALGVTPDAETSFTLQVVQLTLVAWEGGRGGEGGGEGWGGVGT